MSIRRCSKLPNGQVPEMTALAMSSRSSVHLGAKTRREEGHQQCIMRNGIHIYLQQIHLSWEPKISKVCIKPTAKVYCDTSSMFFSESGSLGLDSLFSLFPSPLSASLTGSCPSTKSATVKGVTAAALTNTSFSRSSPNLCKQIQESKRLTRIAQGTVSHTMCCHTGNTVLQLTGRPPSMRCQSHGLIAFQQQAMEMLLLHQAVGRVETFLARSICQVQLPSAQQQLSKTSLSKGAVPRPQRPSYAPKFTTHRESGTPFCLKKSETFKSESYMLLQPA